MIWVLIVCVVLCVLLGGFFAGAETAFVSAPKPLLHSQAQQGDARARAARHLLEDPARLLATTLVGTNLMYVTATSIASVVVAAWAPEQLDSIITTMIMTPTILICAELLPKSLGRGNALRYTMRAARPLALAQRLMTPLVSAATLLSRAALRLAGIKERPQTISVTREEVRTLADMSAEQGVIGKPEHTMIRRVFELNERTLASAMMPLVELVCLPLTTSVRDALTVAEQQPHTQFPVYEGRLDNIVGVLHVLDLLEAARPLDDAAQMHTTVAGYVDRSVPFMPEIKPVGQMLHELQAQRVPLVLVVDEYGGVTGMLTMRDLIEEIVGVLATDRDETKPRMIEHHGTLECDGRLDVDQVSERFGIAFDKDGYDTVAGLLLKLAGRVPVVGEAFTHQTLTLTVTRATRKRINRVIIARATKEGQL
jgi:CBS domain containing-hemolysin-like protein